MKFLLTMSAIAAAYGSRPEVPSPEGSSEFTVATIDEQPAQIVGSVLRADPKHNRGVGTLILCHGYGLSKEWCYSDRWLRDELGWNMVFFDFREHGQSTRTYGPSTLGAREVHDVRAVIDLAEKQGLPRPFIIFGASMGASIGLQAAGDDPRIDAALAFSPFCNGLRGAEQFLSANFGFPVPMRIFGDFCEILSSVDVAKSVAKRDDLPITILIGEQDCFPVADARCILKASKTPDAQKHLFIIPEGRHNQLWEWMGDSSTPSYQKIVRNFLANHARPTKPNEPKPDAPGLSPDDSAVELAITEPAGTTT